MKTLRSLTFKTKLILKKKSPQGKVTFVLTLTKNEEDVREGARMDTNRKVEKREHIMKRRKKNKK